ncbi:flagellar hook-length control protein FliK [Paenibacillus segetis]|uniref:Flagellar hook-length control protein-like C-terminal domain-containing protein n=1 Tax=Paenibacillus segetis TaxID=1325360 RepID=A0ABQ1Y9U7_9BACL|nr:flagellar hook-length control protein FliK [Paenibacillus segetis]GGH17624.1 hypothetical protein GCM10008013_13060 [Paenibacillus segetis]
MSQTVSNLSAGTATNGLWYGASGKSESVQGTGQDFNQTLLMMQLGNAQPQEGQVSAQLLTLTNLSQSTDGSNLETQEDGDTVNKLLTDLLHQLDQMDEALSENPSLLELLQSWLQGIQNLVRQSGSTGNDSAATEEHTELPVLAQHSETMRFAIQDALVQVLTVSEGQQSMGTSNLGQAQAMLQSLQSVLNSMNATQTEINPFGEKQTNNSDNNVSLASLLNKSSEATTGKNASQTVQNVLTSNATQGKEPTISLASVVSSTTKSESGDDQSVSESEIRLHSGNIVTAGQLVMRQAGSAPVKTTAPSVPVENFGKEMSGFLVNKMDIVKLQGISEAKISLYPEHLGQVDVKITMRDGQMIAQFVTETALAKDSLEQQMGQLRSALQAQGLQVSKLEVTQNSSLSSHMYQDGRQPGTGTGNGTGQQQNGKRREIQEDDALLVSDLNEEWNEWISEVRAKEVNYGSSFVAKA